MFGFGLMRLHQGGVHTVTRARRLLKSMAAMLFWTCEYENWYSFDRCFPRTSKTDQPSNRHSVHAIINHITPPSPQLHAFLTW